MVPNGTAGTGTMSGTKWYQWYARMAIPPLDGQPRLSRQSRRRSTPTSPTLSHTLWRLEATSTGGPTSSWTPYGGPRGRPAADSRSDPGVLQGTVTVALRGVMQALVRIQAYLLADVVVAIPAVDLAIESVVCGR